MDYTQARKNMIDGQLTPNKIVNAQLIDRFAKVPREYFVDVSFKKMAYRDNPVKISSDRYIFSPLVTAHMIQALETSTTDNVLVVAAGTGYSSSILCHMVNRVYGVENNLNLLEIGRRALLDAACKSVSILEGAPEKGLESKAPFSKILIDVPVEFVPQKLFEQLKNGGKLVAVERVNDTVSVIKVFSKDEQGNLSAKSLREVVTLPTHKCFTNDKGFEF